MRRLFGLSMVLLAGLVALNSCGMSEDTVAKVGDVEISTTDFKQQLSRSYPNQTTFANVDSAAKQRILDRMIDQALKMNAAMDMDLDKEDSYRSELKMQKARLLGNKYFERVVVDNMISEEMLREQFEQTKDQVKASHVLISYKGARGSRVSRSKEEAYKLAEEIAKRARNGESFNFLAEKYSDDPSAQQNKGNMGYFTWGRMVDEFQQAAFNMEVGTVSDPVETAYGYHIIKKEDQRINPDYNEDNFEGEKFQIKRRLYFAQQDSGAKLWDKHMTKLKETNDLQIQNETIDEVAQIAKAKQDSGLVKPEDYTSDEKNMVLAKWDGGKVKLDDLFLIFSGRRFDQLRRNLINAQALTGEVEKMAIQEVVIQEAEEMGLMDDKEIRASLLDFKLNKLASLAQRKAVVEKADATEEELQEYYQENRSQFTKPAEMEIWEIYLTDESEAKKVARLAKNGSNFEALAKKYSDDKFYKDKKGYIGFKAENRRGDVSRAAFEAGPNQITGPVKYRNGWAVVKTGELRPEAIKSFENAKSQVKSRLRNEKLTQMREEWEKNLRQKYSVKINQELVETV